MSILQLLRGVSGLFCPALLVGLSLSGCVVPPAGTVVTEPAPPLLEGQPGTVGSEEAGAPLAGRAGVPAPWRDPRDDSRPVGAASPQGIKSSQGSAEEAREAALAAAGGAPPRSARAYSPSDQLLITEANQTMDDWHQAASVGDSDRYLGHFALDGVFMGTDASERWDLATFTAYVKQHFRPGAGWTLRPFNRHVTLGRGSQVAWLDEELDSGGYRGLRGTSVLRRDGDAWKIVHYSMVYTIPNEVRDQVMNVVRSGR